LKEKSDLSGTLTTMNHSDGGNIMRILHTSDWHLGRNLEGRSRLPEQEAFIDELMDIVTKNEIQLILIAGDIFDTYNPPAAAEALFYAAVERLSGGGRRAVVVIAGNHDSPDRLCAATPLAARHGISLFGYPEEEPVAMGAYGGVRCVQAGPGWVELAVPGAEANAVVYALPYPSEARLNQVLAENLDEDVQQAAYSERVAHLFKETDRIFRADTVNLAVAHLFAFGGVESDSERQLGGALAVSLLALPGRAQYVALGHLHRPQQVHRVPQICRYSGSPLAYSFSEADQQKEVVIVNVSPGGRAEAHAIGLNCGKALKRWRASSIEEARQWCAQPQNHASWVELEIAVDKPIAPAELAELRAAHPGIIAIRPIFPEQALEAGETCLAELSLEERFRLFYERERGVAPPAELVDFFLEMVNREELADAWADGSEETGGAAS